MSSYQNLTARLADTLAQNRAAVLTAFQRCLEISLDMSDEPPFTVTVKLEDLRREYARMFQIESLPPTQLTNLERFKEFTGLDMCSHHDDIIVTVTEDWRNRWIDKIIKALQDEFIREVVCHGLGD